MKLIPKNKKFFSLDSQIGKLAKMTCTTSLSLSKSWADLEDEAEAAEAAKLSYASVVKGWTSGESETGETGEDEDEGSEFTVVSYKRREKDRKQIEIAVTNAVNQWAMTFPQSTEKLICSKCSNSFFFSVRMKEKYAEKGWKTPKICKSCSQLRYEKR